MTSRRPKNAPRETVAAAVRGAQPPTLGPPVARGGRHPCLCVHAYQGDTEVRVAQHLCPVHGSRDKWHLLGLPPWLEHEKPA